jgi:hypothetical protein
MPIAPEVAAEVVAQNNTPDLDNADPKADRGDSFELVAEKVEVDLTAEELKAVTGKDPEPATEPATEPAEKTAEAVATPDKDGVTQPDKEADEKPRDKDGKFIPKARFDEVNNKAKQKVAKLEGEIADLKNRLAPAEGSDAAALEATLDGLTEQYGQLIADGDLAKAKDVMKEINSTNRRMALIEATTLSSAHAAESRNVDALGELVELYKAEYPVFDDARGDLYKQDMVDFVAKLQGRFEATGSSSAEALREAVELTVAKFGLDAAPSATIAELKPNKGADRKAAATAAAVKAAGAQPPVIGDKVGIDSDKMGMTRIDVNTLDFEQFDKLPETTIKRLRGDFA